ncbi:hypothetical protein LTR09_004524 [Extremus antarcticus]|uniref:Uncharacterized protein n=1 Tax=Extremus antarcticus TaxID=702011 RepID=A0AAJ0DHK7_9PEZI|nr:hypothetical protein LTR09_004524 [Extremus antarcticus]
MDNSPLARLPQELRDYVYDLALSFDNNEVHIEAVRHDSVSPHANYVSVLVYREAVQRVYAENAFCFLPAVEGTPCEEGLANFISSIGAKNAAYLREVRLSSTLSPGMFGNGNFRRSLKKTKQTAELVPACAIKVLLTFLDVYKSIAIRVQLNLQAIKPNRAHDGWIEVLEPITSASLQDTPEARDSMDFLRSHLREYREDLTAS